MLWSSSVPEMPPRGRPLPPSDRFDLVRQALFQNSAVWPCGPYSMDEEQYQGDDGWVHYDTSGWSGQPGQ